MSKPAGDSDRSRPATLGDDVLDDARNGDPVALARALVATPSVNPTLSPGGGGERQVAELAYRWLTSWGFKSDVIEVEAGRANVVARLDGEGPTLLLNGHLDTVGVDAMTISPWGAEISGGRLWGRGACDMKGGVAALLAAAERLAHRGPRPDLVVALTCDEEHASLGMAALVRSGVRADMAVVCEPTNLSVMPAHKGFVWVEASFRGRAAHGSRPEHGIDAIRHAALYVAELEALHAELAAGATHPLLGHGTFHAGTIAGGVAESVYPEGCRLLLERRTLPGESADDVLTEFSVHLDRLRAREERLDATLEITLDRPGTEVGADHPLTTGLRGAARSHGLSGAVHGMTAWVDAAFLNEAGIPALCFGPGDIAQAHSADEWCDLDQIGTCADVLETFARGLV